MANLTTRTQKLLGGIVFLFVAIFAGVVGITALSNPKLSGAINIGYEAYEARIGRDTSYVYFSTLKSAVDGAELGEVIEIISPVSLNENITISKNLTINSMIMQGEDTQRDMAVTVGASGGFTISGSAKVNFGALAGKLSFSQLNTRTTSLFTINSGSTLNVTGGKFSGFKSSVSGTIFNNNGTLNIYGGEFSENQASNSGENSSSGGIIYNQGITDIYGGIFQENKAGSGGVIYNKGTLNIHGGIFQENKASIGGVINISYGGSTITNIYGGTFKENEATLSGGAIDSGGLLNIEGGFFENNSAINGSAINQSSQALQISKNPLIYDSIHYLSSVKIIFIGATYTQPLNITTSSTTDGTIVASVASSLNVKEYIGKINHTNLPVGRSLVANGNNIIIGVKATLSAEGGLGKNENTWDWESGNYVKGFTYNAGLGTLPTPQKEGYTFKGWFTTKTGSTVVNTATKITANTTYYAQWEDLNATGGGAGVVDFLVFKKANEGDGKTEITIPGQGAITFVSYQKLYSDVDLEDYRRYFDLGPENAVDMSINNSTGIVTFTATDSAPYDNYAILTFRRGDTYSYFTVLYWATCFSENTLITVWDEKKKRLIKKKAKDIKYTDKLLVWNFDEGKYDFANPLTIQKETKANEYTEVTFSDGSILEIVADHAVFNVDKNMFTPLVNEDMTPIGTKVMKDNGEIVTVISKKKVAKPIMYTNIFTNFHLNLYTSGILTSTAFNNMYQIKDMKFIKDDRQLFNKTLIEGVDPEWRQGMRLDIIPDNVVISSLRYFQDVSTFADYVKMKKSLEKPKH